MDVETVLVVDVGTTSTKASVWARKQRFDETLSSINKRRKTSSSNLPMMIFETQAIDSRLEPSVICSSIETLFDEVEAQLPTEVTIDVIAFSCLGMALVGYDEQNRDVVCATYDGTCLISDRTSRLDDNQSTGWSSSPGPMPDQVGVPSPFHVSYALSIMRRCRSLGVSVVRWTSFISFCLEFLTGQTTLPISYSEASWWGMFDWRTKDWSNDAIFASGYSRKTFPIVNRSETALKLAKSKCERWPRLTNACLHLGIVDGACAAIGSCPPGYIGCTIGTSAACRLVVPSTHVKEVPEGCFLYVIDEERVVIGGALTDGGSAVDLMLKLTSLSIEHMDEYFKVEQESLSGSSITCLPFFSLSGERAPGWAGTSIPGAIVGLSSRTTKEELVSSAARGVALRLALIRSALMASATGRDDHEGKVYVSGTALTRGLMWQRHITSAFKAKLSAVGLDGSEHPAGSSPKDNTTALGLALLVFGETVNDVDCRVISPLLPLAQDIAGEDQAKSAKRLHVLYNRLLGLEADI